MKTRLYSKLLLILTILFFASTLYAQPKTLQPTGFVNDFAGIIDSSTKSSLDALLSSFERSTSVEVAVVTVPNLNGLPIEDYAVELFEFWGIGKKGKDEGLLILVAPNQRQVRIEVGYGLEGAINDGLAGRIIDQTMIPFFKKGAYSQGVLNGTLASIETVNAKYNLGFDFSESKIAQSGVRYTKKKSSLGSKIFKIFFLLVIIVLFIKNPWAALFILMGMRGGGRSSGGFGGGGGFGGFGGGMSGGGGASGSW